MEGSEGTSQTELYTGWSSVVHQPCEDLEESDLPSTVDITAFSTGLSVEPSNSSGQALNADSDSDSEADSSNSGSEASHSGSQSDSSESDSSTTSQGSTSRSSSPAEFSVTSSQTDGLRLTIATVKKPCGSPCPDRPPSKARSRCSSESAASSASESDSRCSTVSRGAARAKFKTCEVNKDSPTKRNAHRTAVSKSDNCRKIETKQPPALKRDSAIGKAASKVKTKSKGNKKMNSSLAGRECDYCSSDGDADGAGDDSAVMLASCSLQEIRQEDLAAILPDECDAFGAFEQGKGAGKRAPEEAEMSDSDMELPHQAVDALIQRTTESSSESDHELPNPPALYANSLLQQFEAQTQMLSTQLTSSKEKKPTTQSGVSSKGGRSEDKADSSDKSKRRRGRPKKTPKLGRGVAAKHVKINGNSYGLSPNVSPDSGIQNSPDHISSPEPSAHKIPKEDTKEKAMTDKKNAQIEKENVISKLSVTTDRLDRHFYGHSEKTLYPPKRRTGRTSTARIESGRISRHFSKPAKAEEKVQAKNVREKKNRTSQETNETKTSDNKSNHETKRSKSSFLFEICERVSQRLEMGGKLTYRPPPVGQNGKVQKNSKHQKNNHKQTASSCKGRSDVKTKATALKNAKVMHSKHRHKIHKKRKFKILKPLASISQDPKLNAEIEKLIADFTKLCITNNLRPIKEGATEIFKTLKRVSKKRKTNEYERKKKKTKCERYGE